MIIMINDINDIDVNDFFQKNFLFGANGSFWAQK